MKTAAIVIAAVLVAAAVGYLLYRHFVADRISDRGGMENSEKHGSKKQ